MGENASDETKWLLHGLSSLYEEQRYCDVDVSVGEKTFTCHKVILSAASKYFDAMFASGMQESVANTVCLKDVDARTFAELLSFIYTGSLTLTSENAECLLHASCLLQIVHLQLRCERFLIENISPENVVGFWSISANLNCRELGDTSWKYILEHFDDVIHSDEFLKLDKDDFLKIIVDDDLVVQSEETVCSAALRWVKEGESERQEELPDILSSLKWDQVSLHFLIENVYSEPNIHANPACMRILKDAVKYHALPDKRHMYQYGNVKVRNTSEYSSLFIMLGRRQSSPSDTFNTGSTDVLAYDANKNKWLWFCPLPFDLGDEFATCAYGDDIYISGGTTKPELFIKFSSKQYKWIENPPVCVGRYRHCMLTMKESIFCVGGYNLGTIGSIEEFDLSVNTWKSVGRLKYAVDSASAVVHEDNILVFGGWEGFTDETSAIQCFNTKTQACTVIGHLPSPQKETRALSFNDKIYVVFSTGEIIHYEPNKPIKLVHKISDFHKKNFGLLKDRKRLFIMGGTLIDESKMEDKVNASNEILTFPRDVGDDHMILQGPMPAEYEVYGCYRILLKIKYPLTEFSEQFAF